MLSQSTSPQHIINRDTMNKNKEQHLLNITLLNDKGNACQLSGHKYDETNTIIRTYAKRWVILLLYVMVSIVSSMHMMQFTIISNISSRYFGLPLSTIQWSTLVTDATCLFGILPFTSIIDHAGLRFTCILMAVLTTLGTWLKYFFISPNGFIPIMIGQLIIAPCSIPANSLPAMVASHWFGPNEVSTAVTIGYFGMTLGICICNFTIPNIIKNHENLDDITRDLSNYLFYLAITTTVLTVIITIWFDNQPKHPPSVARFLQKQIRKGKESFLHPLKKLLKCKNLLIFMIAYGLCVAYTVTSITMLNPLYLAHFKNREQDVGWGAGIHTIIGTSGSVIFGRIIDRTKRYRFIIMFLYVSNILAAIVLAGSLYMECKWIVFVALAHTGLFGLSYISAGCDACVEMMYPASEVLVTGLLNTSSEFFGVTITLIATRLLYDYSDMFTHLFLILVLVLSLALMLMTKYDQKRCAVSNNRAGTEVDNQLH